MKKTITITALFIAAVGLSGCVSMKKYDQKVQEAQQYQSRASELAEEKNKLESTLEDLKKEKSQLIEEKTALSEDLNDLKNNISELKEERENLNNSLESTSEQLTALNEDLAEAKEEKEQMEQLAQERKERIEQLQDAKKRMAEDLKKEMEEEQITITRLKDKLTLNIVDKLLFDSGVAEIKKEGKDVLERIGDQLKKTEGYEIRIEGHTDNVPISEKLQEKFPTNWELSVARATNVVRFLINSSDIDSKKLSVAGFADTQPIATNETAEGRAKNRRIEIVLVPKEIKRVPGNSQQQDQNEE